MPIFLYICILYEKRNMKNIKATNMIILWIDNISCALLYTVHKDLKKRFFEIRFMRFHHILLYNYVYDFFWMLICLQPLGTDVTSNRICLPVLPTRHKTHLYWNGYRLTLRFVSFVWKSTYFRPGSSCLNWTTVMVKTHFSLLPALSVAW